MGLFDKFKNLFNTKSKDETKEIKEEKEDLVSYEEGLEKTRNVFVNKLNLLNSKHKKVSEEYFEELEKRINRIRQSAVTADVIETSAEQEE